MVVDSCRSAVALQVAKLAIIFNIGVITNVNLTKKTNMGRGSGAGQ